MRHGAVQIALERYLHDGGIRVGGRGVSAEAEVAHAVEDQTAVILLHRLQRVRVRAVNHVHASIDAGVGDVDLALLRAVVQLDAPVKGADDIVRAVIFQLLDRGKRLFEVWTKIAVSVAEIAVNAELQTVRRGNDLSLVVFAEGNLQRLERRPGIDNAVITEIVGVRSEERRK